MSRFPSRVRLFAAAAALPVALAFSGALALSHAANSQEPATAQQPSTVAPVASPAPATSEAPAAAAPAQAPTPNAAPSQVPAAGADPASTQTPVPAAAWEPAPAVPAPAAPKGKHGAKKSAKAEPAQGSDLTETYLKQQLVGKPLYLRGGYLDNYLIFNENGAMVGQSQQGSFTLCGIQIYKVHLTRHKLELEGVRYGLRFLGAVPYEDPTKASVERIDITPKKRFVKITVDREALVAPRLGLPWKHNRHGDVEDYSQVSAKAAPVDASAAPVTSQAPEMSEAEQVKAQIAAAPPEERPADPGSVTATTSPSHAARVLKDALDRVFANEIDERLIASMPAFWKLYYQAKAKNVDYRPADPAVLRQNMVDKKARLITVFEPESNEYAQAHAVAGVAQYHAVIGADGKPGEIVVSRPIGFGLDENAVTAIRHATFEPAIKDGQPVPVMLDLVVQFRIYSNRTAAKPDANNPEVAKPDEPTLPGPYSVQHP